MADKVAASQENNEGVTEDGIEDAFEVGVWMWMHTHPLVRSAFLLNFFLLSVLKMLIGFNVFTDRAYDSFNLIHYI